MKDQMQHDIRDGINKPHDQGLPDPLTLNIKGMVCGRCVSVLKQAFEQMGLRVEAIRLGSVRLSGTSQLQSLQPLQDVVEKHGFALLEDKREKLLEHTRAAVASYFKDEVAFHQSTKLSDYLSEQTGTPYERLSALFSSSTGTTLEHYGQQQRLEKVKEMLVYTERSLTEVAMRTGFSSVSHLSNHFKTMTGLPPSHFRKLQRKKEEIRGA